MDIDIASSQTPHIESTTNTNIKVQQLTDGSVIEIHPDGTMIQKTANGLILETRPDGTRIQTMPDGKRLEIHPSGRVKTIQPVAPPKLASQMKSITAAKSNESEQIDENQENIGNSNNNSIIRESKKDAVASTIVKNESDENQVNNKSTMSSSSTTTTTTNDVKDISKHSSPRKGTNTPILSSKLNESMNTTRANAVDQVPSTPNEMKTLERSIISGTEQQLLPKATNNEAPASPPVFSDEYMIPSTPASQVENDAQINEAEHYYTQFITATRLLMKEKRTREKEGKDAMNKIHQLDKQRLQAEENMKKAQRELASAVAQVEAKYQAQIKSLQTHMRTVSMAAQAQSTRSTKGSALSMLNSSSFFNFGRSFRNRSSLNIERTASTASALNQSSRSEVETLTHRIHELQQELTEQYSQAATAKENANAYLEAAVQSEATTTSLQNEVADLKFQLAKLEKKTKSLKTEKQQLETQIEDLIFKGGSVAEELQKTQDHLKQETVKAEKLNEELETYRQAGNGQIVNQAQQIYSLQKEIRELKEKQASNRLSIAAMNPSAPLTVTQQIVQLQEQLATSQLEKCDLKTQLDGSRKRALEAENQLRKLRGESVIPNSSSSIGCNPNNSVAPVPPPLPSQPLTQMPTKRMSKQYSTRQSFGESDKRTSLSLNNPEHCSAIAELVKLKALQRQARMSKLDNLLSNGNGQSNKLPRPSMGGKREGGPLTLQQMFKSAMNLRRPNIEEDSESEGEEEEDEFALDDNEKNSNKLLHVQSTSKASAQKQNPPTSSTKKPKIRGPMVNDLNDSTAWW